MAFNQFPQKGGIPSGNTAARPSSPANGDTYYNGQKGYLEIYNGTTWLVASAVPGAPSITVADVGTNVAYGSAQASVTLTAPTNGGPVDNYIITATNTAASYTSSSTTATTVSMTLGVGGAYSISSFAINGFGNSPSSPPYVPSLTTVPQAPTISANTSTATTIVFAVTGENGGKAISNYTYSTDGTNYTALSPAQTSSPITVTGLTAANNYTIRLKAVNANGTSIASNAVTYGTAWSYDYVVVGGGAGATGYYYTGGGGAGAMKTGTADGATGVALTVTVGAGGAQQNGPGGDGNPGTSSRLGSVISNGGLGQAASVGTSFLGGTIATTSAGGGTGGYGNDSTSTAGGGGGAGAAGSPGSSGGGLTGNGGVGVSTSISGSSVFYAGGGGGSAYSNGSRGTGGNGGGGNGCKGSDPSNTAGTAGGTNTGGGGGGASHPANGADRGYGYAGGSGRVIIKIPSAFSATFTGGVTQTNTTSSGFKIYQITAAGTTDTVTFS
jgi:hypothetical protein